MSTKSRLASLLDGVGDMALKRRARNIIEGIDPKDGDKILDLGCGDGFYLFLLSNLGLKLKLKGCDFDQISLDAAKANLKGKKITLLKGDLSKRVPFLDSEFDKIILSEVAEHLPNDVKGLKEIYRILKKGGVLCLSVPNANYPLFWDPVNWVGEHFLNSHVTTGFWSGIWFNHLRLYTPNQIEKVIEKAGFRVERMRSLTWWCLPFNHYLVNLVARLLWGGKLPNNLSSSVNKYEKKQKRPFLIELAFFVINSIDKLNDIYQPKDQGVGIFLKAVKL